MQPTRNQEPLTVGGFERWAGTIDSTLQEIREDQKDHGERLARIESRQQERDRVELLAALKPVRPRRKVLGLTTATWTTGLTTILAGVGGLIYRLGWYPAWMEKLVKP